MINILIHRFSTFIHSNSYSTQLHEIGHNLGYAHSREGIKEYGDTSGIMGYGYIDDEGPAKVR